MEADFGSLSDVFAAFFGETFFGRVSAPGRGRHVGRTSARTSRSTSCSRCGHHARVDVRIARRATRAPVRRRPDVADHVPGLQRRRAGPAGHAHGARPDGANRDVRELRRGGHDRGDPCERCEGDGRMLEDSPLEPRYRRGSTTASGSACAAPAMPEPSAAHRATSTSFASGRSRASSGTATTSACAPR